MVQHTTPVTMGPMRSRRATALNRNTLSTVPHFTPSAISVFGHTSILARIPILSSAASTAIRFATASLTVPMFASAAGLVVPNASLQRMVPVLAHIAGAIIEVGNTLLINPRPVITDRAGVGLAFATLTENIPAIIIRTARRRVQNAFAQIMVVMSSRSTAGLLRR